MSSYAEAYERVKARALARWDEIKARPAGEWWLQFDVLDQLVGPFSTHQDATKVGWRMLLHHAPYGTKFRVVHQPRETER